jgi:hypothetical protein
VHSDPGFGQPATKRVKRYSAVLAATSIGVLTLVSFGSIASAHGHGGNGGGGTTTTTTPPPTTTTAPPTSTLLEGAYINAADPSGVGAFGVTTGTKPTIASEYLPASSGWSGMDGSGGSLSWMFSPSQGGWTGTGYTLSLGVPMIPTNAAGKAQGTLAIGAEGSNPYRAYFATLADTLIAAGEGNAYLRLGWEFDGNWYAWDALTPTAEKNYAAYFDNIVTTMRAARVTGDPAPNFSFVWNPDGAAFIGGSSGGASYNVELAYPGAAYVTDVALDIYDESWNTPFTPANAWATTTLPALQAAQTFAKTEAKPMAIAEWGVTLTTEGSGLGDDPLYMNDMIVWMKNPANNVVYESYFDNDTIPDGGDTNAQLTGGDFPKSLAGFMADLG